MHDFNPAWFIAAAMGMVLVAIDFLMPEGRRKKGIGWILLFAGLLLFFVGAGGVGFDLYRKFTKPQFSQTPSSTPPPSTAKAPEQHRAINKRALTPCSAPVGKSIFYPQDEISKMPGGANAKKPSLVVTEIHQTMSFQDIQKAEQLSLFMEVSVTNRGEASTVRNWSLCLVQDGKALRYTTDEIPIDGIGVAVWSEDKKSVKTLHFSRDTSLPELTMQPVEHGRTETGWLLFNVAPSFKDNLVRGKHLLGSLEFTDYLEEKSLVEFDCCTGNGNFDLYVPGAKEPTITQQP
jgi:hypothetical protein